MLSPKHPIFVAIFLLLAGCQQYDSPEMARMSERERDSYRALGKYFYCLQPFVKAAKAGPPLTDSQVNTLGYKCLPELQNAARLRERYFSSMPQDPELHGDLSAPTRIARVKLHEKDLAAALWCDIRICSTM